MRAGAVIVAAALVLLAGGARLAPAATPAANDDATILHALSRMTFGPRPGDVARVKAMGLPTYLAQQLAPVTLDDSAVERALEPLTTLRMSTAELQYQFARPDKETREKMASGQMSRQEMLERYPPDKRPGRITAELQAARMVRAVESPRQLDEVMVDFWLNHFNVFAGKGEVRWYLTAYERDVIRPNALGTFGDLVRGTARHPAMLFYLDNWLSTKPDFTIPVGPQRGKKAGLNENYARELMELHTLGVDGGYTQQDVTEVARALTGWTIDRPREAARFVFRPFMHDNGEKMILGQRLRAGGGESDGERVIEILLTHPSTARFIAGKLVRRFVADDPPPALVERVAATFRQTNGDIRAMLRTIFAAPEFWASEVQRAKIKKPFEFVAGAARALGGSVDTRGGYWLARAAAEIGEGLYEAQPPTGWPDRADAWVNAGALLARMNFALSLAQQRVPGVKVTPGDLVASADRARPEAVLDRLLAAILNGQVTPETRAVLTTQLSISAITRLTADDRLPPDIDVAKLAALVLGSPEFQRR